METEKIFKKPVIKWKCPRCLKIIVDYPAISRRDNETEICSFCGQEEALFDFKINSIINNERKWLKKK